MMILAPSLRVLFPTLEFLGAQVAPNGSDLFPPHSDASRGLWNARRFGAEHYDRRTHFERPSFTDMGRETRDKQIINRDPCVWCIKDLTAERLI